MGRLKVVYWNNIPAPYMVERFNALARRDCFDFEAWFNEEREPDRSWQVDRASWEFRARYLPKIGGGRAHASIPTPLLGRSGGLPDVLVSLYAEPSFLAGWELARSRGVKTAFWCEATFDNWVRRRWWKDAIKRHVFARVDMVLAGGEDARAFALRCGAREDNTLILRHAMDIGRFISGGKEARAGRNALRDELGLRGPTFVYVGRLWSGKGVNHLLDAFASAQDRVEGDISLLLLGDGPDEDALRRQASELGLRNVVFAGFKQRDVLPRYYAASDVLVFPTLGDPYGQVVDEAMACAMPVLSSSAAGEIRDRVDDGRTGFIVPPANSAALADRMVLLARDEALRTKMGAAGKRKIAPRTADGWAESFERAVYQIVGGRPATGEAIREAA